MPELHTLAFVWPALLWLQGLLPLLALAYLWRRRRHAAPWPGAQALPPSGWRDHLPALCLLLGLALLLLAVARPRAVILLPGRTDAVMLLIDSSGSMRADDVKPSRIEAAQAAARAFIDAQPAQVRLGIVSVAGSAAVAQAPTDDRNALYQAVEGLALQRGSALGSGIVIGLATLLPAAGLDVPALLQEQPSGRPSGAPLPEPGQKKPVSQMQAEPGSNSALAMVLLSDGQSNLGPDLLKMAELAASLGVRVYTVGLGTPEGTVLRTHGMSARVRLDEAALQKVAQITRADYFRAASRQELLQVYRQLGSRIVLRKHQLAEISGPLALLGMLWVCLGAAWSFLRHGRIA